MATGSLALLAGPQILGAVANWGLQGALTVQVYFYHLSFPNDPLSKKLLVYGLLVWEWVQTALITDFAFEVYVYNFGSVEAITQYHNSWFSVTIMASLVSATVQAFFVVRIWGLSHSKVLCAVILFFAFGQMSVGVAGGIMLHVLSPTADIFSSVTPVLSAWLAGAAFVDALIAASMTYFLWQAKTGNNFSGSTINRLIALVVETGTLTAAFAITDVVCFTAASDTLLHEFFAVVLAKLYANTLLVALNNRAYIKIRGDTPTVHTVSASITHRPQMSLGLVNIRSETIVMQDADAYAVRTKESGISDRSGEGSAHTYLSYSGL